MLKKRILFICGSLNQTTMLHKIASCLPEAESVFSPYYSDGALRWLGQQGYLDWTILGGAFRQATEDFLREQNAEIDYEGRRYHYDLVVTCQDLIVPRNVRHRRLVLVQEGMTDPETLLFHLVKWLKIPRYLASTAATGLSDAYTVFCVASEGYRDAFIRKGVRPEKIVVTGIPNFDNCRQYLSNSFPHAHYVLCATSDSRETFKYENRKKFILDAVTIAGERELIFKLHPNEDHERAIREIQQWAPHARVFTRGNAHEMVANADELITRFSTLVYTGLALGKKVHSEFPIDELKRLLPIQNGGSSAHNIAEQCRRLLHCAEPHSTWKGRSTSRIMNSLRTGATSEASVVSGTRSVH